MIIRQVIINNKLGLHARAAAKFVGLASEFECEVNLQLNGRKVNGKSIMGVMMLAAGIGTELDIIADGCDEAEAIEQLERLVADRFGEAE